MKWNYESLAELYYEDTEKLLAKAGIAVSEATVGKQAQRSASGLHLEADGSFTCQVCYDTFEGEEVAANVRVFPSCGHAMCKGCWFQQLKTQIIDEGVSVRIACPGFSMINGKVVRCNIILDERFVGNLLKEVELAGEEPDAQRTRARYQKQLNDNYVNNNHSIKWCPATDCTSAVRIKDSFDASSFCTDVLCSHNHPWCFNCMDEPHAPADCTQVKDWRKKCAEDSATCSWLVQFTKDCPKCKIAINKDGGCNHMHCKQCDHHFCWVCLGHFEHTTYQHTCNKFVEDGSKTASASRTALQRYTHHYERFANHAKSRELESKLRDATLDKMEKMQDEGNKTWLDVQFMKQATAQLIEARQILQWTYVIGFYEPPWLQTNIFSMNQSELETATEKLSNMLEHEDILKWCNEGERVDMINQTNQVKTRLKHLFGAMEAWKRGEAEEAVQAASRCEWGAHAGSSAALKGGAESGKAAGIKRSDSEGDSSVRPSVSATNTAKRPLKKVASGSSE
eukprot:Tamp_01618.p3 GENE.Tamp_01618~~Tamp_01618.p3  ORF type:complete len:510 (-),score=134.29 Tamp_01618:2953-4482(-)